MRSGGEIITIELVFQSILIIMDKKYNMNTYRQSSWQDPLFHMLTISAMGYTPAQCPTGTSNR